MYGRVTNKANRIHEGLCILVILVVLPSTEFISDFVDSPVSSSKNAQGKNISLHHQSMQQNAVFVGSPRSSIKNKQEEADPPSQPQNRFFILECINKRWQYLFREIASRTSFVEHNTTRYGASQVIIAIINKIRLNAASESMWIRQRSSLHLRG
jgi:hypothetical protein